jgi:VanZ family protein
MKDILTHDKLLHFALSAIISMVLSAFLPSWAAICITMGIGIAKELYDHFSKQGQAEVADLLADLIGAIVGGV